jgi:3-oxoacyl-[acyl-carrier-protein] synthase-1
VLVGAIDSYWDMGLLEALDGEGRLKTGAIADGFVPGEGAAFILVGSPRVEKRPSKPRVRIVAAGIGNEAGHLYSQAPYHGDGLAEAFRAAFAAAAPSEIGQRQVGCVYAGLNGESHWAKEWGVSHIRNAHRFAEPVRLEHPADCMGDPGAALGLILLGLAAYRQDPDPAAAPSLVWCSSDREPRAAVLIAR